MRYPMNFGMSKISMLRGEQEGPYGPVQEKQRRGAARGGGGAGKQGELAFSLEDSGAGGPPQPPSFNVLYVSTPRIGLLQTPEFQGFAALWGETVALVAPLLRFGLPETSLRTKCKYYNEKLYASEHGIVLANDRTRTLMRGVAKGAITPRASSSHGSGSSGHHNHHHHHHQEQKQQQDQPAASQRGGTQQQQQQQQQPAASGAAAGGPVEFQNVGPFGLSTLVFLAKQVIAGQQQQQQQRLAARDGRQEGTKQAVLAAQQQQRQQQEQQAAKGGKQRKQRGKQKEQQQQAAAAPVVEEQHPERAAIPRSRLLVPDIPSGSLVLALNLGAYWAITKQARRSSMGGTMMGG